jgi:hypothetical protein
MTKILSVFFLLQIADLATTVWTLKLGGAEINPLVLAFMTAGPLMGLFLAKVVVMLVAVGCALLSKHRTLQRANVVFAGIVAWNLSVIARLIA